MSKLTLNISEEIIIRAKEYAAKQNRSLSSIIETFLKNITVDKEKNLQDFPISQFVKDLSLPSKLPADFDYKKEMGERLSEKYNR